MPDVVDNARRNELAELVASEFIATGTAQASLREIAIEVGSSARMLVHYFESRENLVAAGLEIARARQLGAARKVIAGSANVEEMFENTWLWYKRADTRRYFALFTEVAALERAASASKAQFGQRLGSEWWPMFDAVFLHDKRTASNAPELARLLVATIRGFALDLHSGAKPKDQRATYDVLVGMILER